MILLTFIGHTPDHSLLRQVPHDGVSGWYQEGHRNGDPGRRNPKE
jgi:hypothetical protein